MLRHAPVCWIVAGPNGAGKTTFALDYLPRVADCRAFVNADLIAAGLAPLAPEGKAVAAGRLFLREIRRNTSARRDFGFETTLSGLGYRRLIRDLRSEGWRVELIYLALPSIELARRRVAERVRHGGHDVPRADIERRWFRGLDNFFGEYVHLADRTTCYGNADAAPVVVFTRTHREVAEPATFPGLGGPAEATARPDDYAMEGLKSLRRAVANALERKRRLGQYAVFWRDGRIVYDGPDAPSAEDESGESQVEEDAER